MRSLEDMVDFKLNPGYESWLNIIESQLKVFNYVSCQRIFIHLRLCGKKSADELMNNLNYSRGAIHTALNLLLDAEYIKKVKDPNVKDKRTNVYYYAIDKDFSLIDEKEFVNYVIKRNKLDLYLKWLKKSVKMSTSMINEIYQIAISAKTKEFNNSNTMKQYEIPLESNIKRSIISFSVMGSITNQNKVISRIMDFLTEIENEIKLTDSSEDPIPNPTLVSLFYIPV